jgi:tetratricopeptide (TPR) repeat protein
MIEESSMKRIVKAALLTCVAAGLSSVSFAQGAAAPAAAPAAGGQCQMPDAEYQVYNNANTQTQPAAKAAALEAYLTQFPNSCAKLGAMQELPQLYLQAGDLQKAVSAADRVLQLDPNNVTVLAQEAFLHYTAASKVTDTDPAKVAAERQPELDQAASYAQKALAAPKPANVADADFTKFKEQWYPLLDSYIAFAALNKKDSADAEDFYKKEFAFVQGDPTLAPMLQTAAAASDTYFLATAYWQSQPPDYLNCAFYATRAANLAQDAAMKTQATQISKFCYHQYHGQNDDQYTQLTQIAQSNVTPPANLGTTITPAPTPAETIAGILKTTTPDQLATADKEYILQNGSPDQVQQVWDSMKGKSLQFPDVLVIASTPQQVQVAATDNAKAEKTADFTFNLAAPEDLPAKATPLQKRNYDKKQAAIAAAIAPGQTVTLSGTFDSYTPKPFMITMSDGQVVLPEAAKPTKPSPAHRAAPAGRRATH